LQEFESGQGVFHFPVFQQLQLQSVARLLTLCGGFAVHQVNGASALVCGKPDAMSKQVQEYIAMASEYWSEFLGIALIRSEVFQIFTGTAAAVIQQDGRERSGALRAPYHRVQDSRPTVDRHRFWPARGLAPGHRGCEC
jgi:hypothetical protein